MLDSTCKILDVLENMFSLNVDGSDSSIKLLPAMNIKKLERLGPDPLFTVSSQLTGEMKGSLTLLMNPTDFKQLGEVLKPTLKLLFLSNPDADLSTLKNHLPEWMEDDEQSNSNDSVFFEQMMDASKELGNMIFGIYTDAIYKVFDLHTQHSMPEFSGNTQQQTIHEVLTSQNLLDKQHFLIENEFTDLHRNFGFLCLISPSRKSLKVMLERVG
jgi:chemotaxis protein CheY-P-specific phosphatase CheC